MFKYSLCIKPDKVGTVRNVITGVFYICISLIKSVLIFKYVADFCAN